MHNRLQLCTFVAVLGLFGPLFKENLRHKTTTIVGNGGQLWTSHKYLKPPFAKPPFRLSRFVGVHSRFLFATRTPNSQDRSYVDYSLSKFTSEWFTTLSFLSLFFGIPCFFPLRGIPCFFERFPFFSRDFRGSVGIKNPCFFGGFPCLFGVSEKRFEVVVLEIAGAKL